MPTCHPSSTISSAVRRDSVRLFFHVRLLAMPPYRCADDHHTHLMPICTITPSSCHTTSCHLLPSPPYRQTTANSRINDLPSTICRSSLRVKPPLPMLNALRFMSIALQPPSPHAPPPRPPHRLH
jgi:hypothetical protein